ncbi:hypothetical protein [Glutamicibacter sp. AOP5-A2-18]|uniref:hypothetical protein n=1 Tax=Glutamicibacter sp. AOP5-A2-18 TaxID=3457656 RepID=UPI0040331C40
MSNQTDFLALLASLPAQAKVYPSKVPDNPTFPYILVRSFIPRATDRSLVRSVHARVDRWRVTVVSLTHESVAIIDAECRAVLEGARINLQRVEEVPASGEIIEDLDVTLTNGAHPFYTVQEWRVMQ